MDAFTLLFFVSGFLALIVGAELMVRGAARIAVTIGISPLVVGLTVVAFGTSAPELGVSAMSSLSGKSGLAIGNVVGSNIANTLLILGFSAIAAPLIVSRQLLRIEVPLMLGVSLLIWGMALDGTIGRFEGLLLFSLVVCYTVWSIRRSRQEKHHDHHQSAKKSSNKDSGGYSFAGNLILILIGLFLLGAGSNWLVSGAVALATHFGVSDLLIGLTIVSIGTSLPELATSVLASLRGHREMAVGNIIGSNIFNILLVLGLTATITPDGMLVSTQALNFDIPVMVMVTAACVPIFVSGYRISRGEGALLAGYYFTYTLYLVLSAVDHPALPALSSVLLLGALPLTVFLMICAAVRTLFLSESRISDP